MIQVIVLDRKKKLNQLQIEYSELLKIFFSIKKRKIFINQ